MIRGKIRFVQFSINLVPAMVLVVATSRPLPADEFAAPLPAGVTAAWDLARSYRETTPTRERICLNGLWRWQPAQSGLASSEPPKGRWGYFKVPGCWPGVSDYLQKDCQTLYRHSSWNDARLGSVRSAWYEREFHVPDSWAGRRIAVASDYVNSIATVFIDGKHAGEIRFPSGELDITAACRPGAKHLISLLVAAVPLNAVMLSYVDTAAARQARGTVARRGLCGDVFLESTPAGARITQVRVDTSVRKAQISLDTAMADLSPSMAYTLRGSVRQDGREVIALASKPLRKADLERGRIAFATAWKPDRLWDLHTPGNVYSVSVSLLDDAGRVLDCAPREQFGFREFWIDGRDFYLNGTRIFLSAVPLDNALVSAAQATYAATSETLRRLKSFGINMVYTHNYGCEPGSHLSYAEILRAADDAGMLVSFTQPHFSHYNWKAPDADRTNGYARHAEFYARAALNHPSIVFYSMSHNATGYEEDMNPRMIDGLSDPREAWAKNNTKLALRAEAIVRMLDPGRIVYHHASGNLGSMHDSNFYPNFAPIQELSDWFEHWATKGVKPVFTCEYGAPFTWDWSMYRGWYKGQRSFGSATVPWELCLAEWNAQFLGDKAYRLSDMEKANLRWEAKQFHAGKLWHRWDYPYEIGSRVFGDRHEVIGMYLADNLRAFRTWGVSAISPWEYGHFWKPRSGIDKRRRELEVDWSDLQRPGFSPDYIDRSVDRMDMAYELADWKATADGLALIRNNRPLLAYVAGKPARFTSKDHVFQPGETIEKQFVVLNNSRQTVTCECDWSLEQSNAAAAAAPIGHSTTGRKKVTVLTGQQDRIPLKFELPRSLAGGTFQLTARAAFSTGETQEDSFAITVLPVRESPRVDAQIALFDPEGATGTLLSRLGIGCQPVDSGADLAGYDILIVGKSALKLDRAAPSIDRVRRGLKVIVFEQRAQVLEKRLGFRVQEYGLRQVFPRVADHPILSGIAVEHLRDWRGDATILSPHLDYELRPRYGPTVRWCDIPVPRVWRCGNQGNVASVLIEKPGRGNVLPIVDGGFSLQYSPLLEYREGQGLVLFCQLDVTGRTESDPVARALVQNIIGYVAGWKPVPNRSIIYAGDPAGLSHLAKAGFKAAAFQGKNLSPHEVLVAGPGAGKELAGISKAIAQWLKAGGNVLGIGLHENDARSFLPFEVRTKNSEHISAYFEPFNRGSPFVGTSPADVHNRDPRKISLVSTGANAVGDGVLARAQSTNVVFCQLVPWQFEDVGKLNIKRTFRRASFLVSQLLTNMGAEAATPLLRCFQSPVAGPSEKRWLEGLYLDRPEEMDDPYRFFRW
jgi:beta-galactosidase